MSKGKVLTYASTAATATTDWHTRTTTLSQSSTIGAIAVVGYNVERMASSTTSTSSFESSMQQPTLSPTSSETPTATNTGVSVDTGLSPGAKAGIALGTIVACSLVGLLVWVAVRRCRSRQNGSAYDRPELVDGTYGGHVKPVQTHVYAQAHPLFELADQMRTHELPPAEAHSPIEMDTRSQ